MFLFNVSYKLLAAFLKIIRILKCAYASWSDEYTVCSNTWMYLYLQIACLIKYRHDDNIVHCGAFLFILQAANLTHIRLSVIGINLLHHTIRKMRKLWSIHYSMKQMCLTRLFVSGKQYFVLWQKLVHHFDKALTPFWKTFLWLKPLLELIH